MRGKSVSSKHKHAMQWRSTILMTTRNSTKLFQLAVSGHNYDLPKIKAKNEEDS